MLISPQLPLKQSTYVLQGAWLYPQTSKVHARGFPDYRDNCALSRVCCSQPGTSRAPATRYNTQRQRVPGRLDSEGKCRKPVNRCRLSSKEPGGSGWPPPTNSYQLITLQGSGPPWEESILVHSFLGYELPAHLTHDGRTWELAGRQRHRQKVPGALRPPRCCLAPTRSYRHRGHKGRRLIVWQGQEQD